MAEWLTPRTPDLEVRGSNLARRVVSLDKELYSTLSLFTQVYNLRSGPILPVLIHSLKRLPLKSLFVSPCPPECYLQSETKIEPDLRLPRGYQGRFTFNKNSGLKIRKFHVLNGTVHSGCTDPGPPKPPRVLLLWLGSTLITL